MRNDYNALLIAYEKYPYRVYQCRRLRVPLRIIEQKFSDFTVVEYYDAVVWCFKRVEDMMEFSTTYRTVSINVGKKWQLKGEY